ncbi:MAG: hypothetical protein LAT52_03180 [Balneolales bacterium]|nr:hypothetical protein [Balneolales bacterium]
MNTLFSMHVRWLFLSSLLFFIVTTAYTQSSFNGYLRHETGLAHTREQPLIFSRNVANIDFSAGTSTWQFRASPQLRQNLLSENPTGTAELRLREAYVEWFSDNWDIRVGRQILIAPSGVVNPGNEFFSPLDLSEFIAQDISDIQLGITAANIQYFRGNNSFQAIFVPVFESSILPDANSRWNLLPIDALTGGVSPLGPDLSYRSGRDLQASVGWQNRSLLTWDFNFRLFYGYYPLPGIQKEITFSSQTGAPNDILLRYSYEKSTALRFSSEYRSPANWIIGTQLTYWHDRVFDTFPPELSEGSTVSLQEVLDIIDSYNSTSFQASSPFITMSVSAQQTWLNTRVLLQYQFEQITHHRYDILQDEFFHSVDFSASRSVFNDFIQFRLNGRYNVNGRDFWVNPNLTYTLFDGLSTSLGSQFFSGKKPDPLYAHLSFYQFRQNSFSYLKLTAYW